MDYTKLVAILINFSPLLLVLGYAYYQYSLWSKQRSHNKAKLDRWSKISQERLNLLKMKEIGISVSVEQDSEPSIQWNHIDGPLLHCLDGSMHWLTLREKVLLRWKKITIGDLNDKYSLLSVNEFKRLRREYLESASMVLEKTSTG